MRNTKSERARKKGGHYLQIRHKEILCFKKGPPQLLRSQGSWLEKLQVLQKICRSFGQSNLFHVHKRLKMPALSHSMKDQELCQTWFHPLMLSEHFQNLQTQVSRELTLVRHKAIKPKQTFFIPLVQLNDKTPQDLSGTIDHHLVNQYLKA